MYDFYTTVAYPIFNSLFSSRLASLSPPRGNREHIIPGKPRIMQIPKLWGCRGGIIGIGIPVYASYHRLTGYNDFYDSLVPRYLRPEQQQPLRA